MRNILNLLALAGIPPATMAGKLGGKYGFGSIPFVGSIADNAAGVINLAATSGALVSPTLISAYGSEDAPEVALFVMGIKAKASIVNQEGVAATEMSALTQTYLELTQDTTTRRTDIFEAWSPWEAGVAADGAAAAVIHKTLAGLDGEVEIAGGGWLVDCKDDTFSLGFAAVDMGTGAIPVCGSIYAAWFPRKHIPNVQAALDAACECACHEDEVQLINQIVKFHGGRRPGRVVGGRGGGR